MVGILKPACSGACWICGLNGKIDFDYAASVFLAACRQLFEPGSELVYLIVYRREKDLFSFWRSWSTFTSRCVCISSPLLRPSRSKMLHDGLKASSVNSLSLDLTTTSGLVVRLDVVMFWGREGPTSSHLLLIIVVERVDSAYERETCCEFAQWVEVALPHVVALATCYSTLGPSTADRSLGVSWPGGITIL